MYSLLTFIYLFIGILTILLGYELNRIYIGLLLFMTIKIITNYDKCTISYIECKIRGVKKENGFIYNIMNNFMELRKSKYSKIFTIMSLFILTNYYLFHR